jgi:Ni,Fe-hydrogenase I cytochrome b subunit
MKDTIQSILGFVLVTTIYMIVMKLFWPSWWHPITSRFMDGFMRCFYFATGVILTRHLR